MEKHSTVEIYRKGHVKCIDLLLKSGADVNVESDSWSRHTPLFKAVKTKNLECVVLLCEAGACVNKADTDENTLLLKATSDCEHSYVDALVKMGADMNASNLKNETALIHTMRTTRQMEPGCGGCTIPVPVTVLFSCRTLTSFLPQT